MTKQHLTSLLTTTTAIALTGLALAGCGTSAVAGPSAPSTPSVPSTPYTPPAPPSATHSVATTGRGPGHGVEDYTRGGRRAGITIDQLAQATRLTGTTAAFRDYIGGVANQAVAYGRRHCPSFDASVTVERYSHRGFAVGGVGSCGSYRVLWGRIDGDWKQLATTQDAWDCSMLKRNDVPSALVGTTCVAYRGDHHQHPYHSA